MKAFILGIVVTLVALVAAGYVSARFGLIDMRADQVPSRLETTLAGVAMDSSVARHAPALNESIQSSDANLLEGMKIYRDNCAQCHGDSQTPESTLAEYPPAPQFMSDHGSMLDNQIFYIIKHGVRWTAMPGWEKRLSDEQIWKVTSFLSHMERLPPVVEQQWRNAQSR